VSRQTKPRRIRVTTFDFTDEGLEALVAHVKARPVFRPPTGYDNRGELIDDPEPPTENDP